MTKRNRIKMARTTIAANKTTFSFLTVVVFRWLGLSLTGDLIPRVGIVFKPFFLLYHTPMILSIDIEKIANSFFVCDFYPSAFF